MASTSNNWFFLNQKVKIFWKNKWAKQVLTIEQNVTIKERLKQQKKYANTLSSGEKAFIVRWKLTVNFNQWLLFRFFEYFLLREKREKKQWQTNQFSKRTLWKTKNVIALEIFK